MRNVYLPYMFFIFFVLGEIAQSVISKTSGLLSWMTMILFIEVYAILLIWFNYEVNLKEEIK